MKLLKRQEKENFVDEHHQTTDMSLPGLDIFTKIRNLIRGTTETNSLKRRSEEQPEISNITKYRRVSNDFPKIITKPFEDDVRFIHPVMSNKRSASDKKSSLNKYSTITQQHQQQHQQQQPQIIKSSNRSKFAEIEYSDDDDDISEQQLYSRPLASSSFNTTDYIKNINNQKPKYQFTQLNDNNQLNINNNKLNTTPYVVNIPIKLLDNNKKPLPPLIEAKTGNILGPSSIPSLRPIRKNNYNLVNHQHNIDNIFNNNGYSSYNGNKIDQQYLQQQQQISDNITTTSAFPIQWSNFNKQQNAKNLAHSSYLIGNTNSVVSQVYNVKQRNSYADLLKKLAPTIYNSCEKLLSSSASSSGTEIKPNARRSIHCSNTGGNGNKSNIIDHVDLTLNERKNKYNNKSSNIIYLDDDDDLNIVDLDDDEVHIVTAYNKINRRELKEQKRQQEIDKKNELPIVEPVNSLKDKNILSPVYEPQWLENFKLKCQEKHRIRNQKITEATEEARKQTEETERHERIIEQKLKNFIISSETVVLDESEEEEEIEFPVFTEAEDATIKKAIYRGSSDENLITKFNMNITRRDIQTLMCENWLNDEIINFYMNLIMERGEQRNSEGYPKVYTMNTFFIPRLMSSGHSGVRRWTRKVDIFNYDIIPVPVHVGGVHWCMAIIHLKDKTIKYYDSMGTPNIRVLNALEQYLKDESLDKKKIEFDTSNFKKEFVSDCPRQMNGSDCGVFSCMFAEYISRGRNITFSQQHMNYFRLKMVLEIVNGKLLL